MTNPQSVSHNLPAVDLDLCHWLPDGNGSVVALGDNGFEVRVTTPLTLWCRSPLESPFEVSFDCQVLTPNSAMLLMACTQNWRGGRLITSAREGTYDEYNSGDLELYTVGFNRTGHVTSDIQPNASMVNVRRIGGAQFTKYGALTLANATPAMKNLWCEWDTASLLASVREPVSGTSRYFHYEMRFACPKITMRLEQEELFTVADHRPEPLSGGHVGLRCMTPGGSYRVRNVRMVCS